MHKVCSGQVYRHFKGFLVVVVAIAKHTETNEELVVYTCVSHDANHKGGIFARPLDMFYEKIDKDKYPEATQEYRFELISE